MNDRILKKRWQEVDKKLSAFHVKNNKLNKQMYIDLQNVFDGIKFTKDELQQYAKSNYIAKLRVEIDYLRYSYDVEGYVWYKLKQLYKRIKLRNNEVLNGLILVAYYKNYLEQQKIEKKMFDEIISVVYTESQEEVINTMPPIKKKKARLLTVPEAFALQLIGMSGFNGYKWYDYKEGNVIYNARKMYELALNQMAIDKILDIYNDTFMKLLKKQEKVYFNKKKDVSEKYYESEFSGMLDNEVSFLVNQVALQGMIAQGCKKVQFIAVMDNDTTEMCESLDGQIFNIFGWNTYSRYSKEDDRNVIYKTKGLVVGDNLPPITNGFHYCRSTIYPYR